MPLAHLPHPPRSGKPQDPPLRRTQGRGRHDAGAVALLVGLIGSGAGMATAAGTTTPARRSPLLRLQPSTRIGKAFF